VLLVVAAKTLFIWVVVVVLFAPVVTGLARRQSASLQSRRPDESDAPSPALLHPGAGFLQFVRGDAFPPGNRRLLRAAAPFLVVLPALVASAVIPFGGRYSLGDSKLSLVAADVDWGVLYVLAIGALAGYGALLAGWASDDDRTLLAGVRSAAQRVSYGVALGLSLVGVFVVFGSLKLSEIGLAQDASLRVFGLLERSGWLSSLPAPLEWLRLPSWGIVLQPLGFAMFLIASLGANERPPFDRPESEFEPLSGPPSGASGVHFGLFYVSEFVQVVVIAALCTAIFLGGWSIPYLSQATILGALGPLLGEGVATVLCMLLHMASFFGKVVGMVWLQIRLRDAVPRLGYKRAMDLCWKWMLPLAVLNALATAAVLLACGPLLGSR
jgi:NADH-quinone oxidoreductase subunit H